MATNRFLGFVLCDTDWYCCRSNRTVICIWFSSKTKQFTASFESGTLQATRWRRWTWVSNGSPLIQKSLISMKHSNQIWPNSIVYNLEITVSPILVSFSMPRNWYKLISDSSSELSRDLRAINAMRTFCMFGVICAHAGLANNISPQRNTYYMEEVNEFGCFTSIATLFLLLYYCFVICH